MVEALAWNYCVVEALERNQRVVEALARNYRSDVVEALAWNYRGDVVEALAFSCSVHRLSILHTKIATVKMKSRLVIIQSSSD